MPSDGMPMMGGAPPSPTGAPPASPPASPPAAPGGAPGAVPPPTGPSGATMPIANQGLEAAAMAKLGNLAQQLQMILAALPVGGDAARDVREAINKIAKHVGPGKTNRGVEMTDQQRQLMQQRQMGPQVAALRAGERTGGGPPAPPAPQAMD